MKNNEVLQAAYSILSRRAYSERELRLILLKKNYDQEQVDEVISYLMERGYLNDTALCGMHVRKYIHTGKYGKKAIVSKGRQRGLDSTTIHELLEEYQFDELAQATQIVEKKLRHAKEPADVVKIGRYLANRGFSFSVITRILDQIDVYREK